MLTPSEGEMDERKHKGTCWRTGNALFLVAHKYTFMKIHQAYDMCTFLNVSYTPIKNGRAYYRC